VLATAAPQDRAASVAVILAQLYYARP